MTPTRRSPSGARGRGRDGAVHRLVDGVVLVVAGELLDDGRAVLILEDDEMPHQLQEARLLEYAFQHDLQFRHRDRCEVFPRDGAPRHEPLFVGRQRTDAGLHAVRDNEHRVPGEQRGNLLFVGLQLVEGAPEGRVLVGGVLEFDHRQRKPVDEQHHIGATLVFVLDNRELIHREEVVVGGGVEVDHPDDVAAERAIGALIFDGNAFDEQSVHGVVASSDGECGRVSLRNASLMALAGTFGLSRVSASRNRPSSTTCDQSVRSAPGCPQPISGPCATL